MKTKTSDSIVAEVRASRDKHAAQFGYDIKEIFRHIREQQQASGRKYVRYPARPVVSTHTANPSQ
ncbi:MAG: hypothetical protein GKR94_25395 [Gammaproteobacteria bacterium]|nr:hypothetical protein [Gammaproteobacteria bacterium]